MLSLLKKIKKTIVQQMQQNIATKKHRSERPFLKKGVFFIKKQRFCNNF